MLSWNWSILGGLDGLLRALIHRDSHPPPVACRQISIGISLVVLTFDTDT